MAGSSYAVRRETLTPTAAIIAKIVANTPEKSIAYPKLEQILFLADWKCAQATSRSRVDTGWTHDDENVNAVGLFQKLGKDNHFVLSNENTPKSARVSLARTFEIALEPDVQQAIGAHIRFLDGQSPSALRKMCAESYPVRSSRPGKKFHLDDRFLAYKQSRRMPA